MSRLEQLPQGVRREIFRYLLLSHRVRQPPNHLLVEHYVFEVNLLRVNRAIKRDSAAVLYGENAFVKIRSDFTDASVSMHNHEVPFFLLKDKFEHHVAEITTRISAYNKRLSSSMKLSKPLTFLLVLADVPKYTRLLRLLDLANFMAYEFEFKAHHPPLAKSPLSIVGQEQLLIPFECLRGSAMVQKVSFTGTFDTAITERVKEAMTQKIAWLRAGVWETYNMALSIKRKGDWAFRLKNADIALAKYQDMQSFLDTALDLNSMMKGIDAECEKSICAITVITLVDTALLMLSDFMLKEVGKEAYAVVTKLAPQIAAVDKATEKDSPVVPYTVTARFFYLLGVAELGLNHPIKAGKAFAQSYKMVSDKTTQDGHRYAKAWADLGKKAKESRLNTMLTTLPTEPLAIPDMETYMTPEVESEKWVMRELGLKGPIPYEDKIKGAWCIILTDKPHPNHHNQGPRTARVGEVKPEVLRKHVNHFRKSINLPAAKGRLICWVGLNANQIGEETVLDNPGFVESMRNMGSSGCNPQ
jgi:hypothetical protein